MSNLKETKVYCINDFINWYMNDTLEISPKYQRNSVWNLNAKSYLIDTILRGLPVPQVLIRQIIDTKARKTFREVIDGQQRLRTIIGYYNDSFKILKLHNTELAGKTFSELDEERQTNFLNYDLPVEIIKTSNDSIVYDMFARLNTNSMTLNKQELRNAKYWGEFKVFIYNLAAKWRDFFIEIGMFNDKSLSRMSDIEFVSSLVILLIDGIVGETANKIDSYYKKYDSKFQVAEDINQSFDNIMFNIKKVFDDKIFDTDYFHRKVYFYTLFASLKDILDTNELEHSVISNIIERLLAFESFYSTFMANDITLDEPIKNDMIKFEQFHRTRTTSANERFYRVTILKRYLGSDMID